MRNCMRKSWLSSMDFWMIDEEDIQDDIDHMNYLNQKETLEERKIYGKKLFRKVKQELEEDEDLFSDVFFHYKDGKMLMDERENILCFMWDEDRKKIEIQVDDVNCRLKCKAVLAKLACNEKEYAVELANEMNRFLRLGKMYMEKDTFYYASCLVYVDEAEIIDFSSYLEEASLVCSYDIEQDIRLGFLWWTERKEIRMMTGARDVYSCSCLGKDGSELDLSDVFLDYELPENACVFKSLHGVYVRSEEKYIEYLEGLNEGLRTSKDDQFTYMMQAGLRFAQNTFARLERKKKGEVYCKLPESLMEDLQVSKGRIFAIVEAEEGEILLFANDMERLGRRYSIDK